MIPQDTFEQVFPFECRRFILDWIRLGLGDYEDPFYYGPDARYDHTSSVRAQIRNCHIVARACCALIDRLDIRVMNKRGRILFLFNDKYLVSMKKFDGRLRTANVPTQQALNFQGQQQLDLEMPPQVLHIFAGYKYDLAEAHYEVYITCPNDQLNHWVWKISGAEIHDFFAKPATNADIIGSTRIVQKRVRIRLDVQRKENGNE